MNGGDNMPKGYGYSKQGWKKYFKDLRKKRKKVEKATRTREDFDYGDQAGDA